MKLIEMRQARAARLKEARKLYNTAEAEQRDMTEDEVKRYDEIMADVDKRAVEIERLEKLETAEATIEERTAKPVAQNIEAGTVDLRTIRDPRQRWEAASRSFKGVGDFVQELATNPNSARMREYRDMTMGIGAEGGVLVPHVANTDLLAIGPEQALIRPRARVIPPGASPDASMSWPALKQGSAGVYGGVTVLWTAEGKPMTETDADLSDIRLEPKEMTAYIEVTNKLLRNAGAAEMLIRDLLSNARAGAEDFAFMQGDGVGRPHGVIKSPGRLSVNRNTASQVLYEDIVNMEAAVLPQSQSNVVFVASQSAFTYLKDMKDSAGNRIYTETNLVKGFFAALDGIPLAFTGRLPTLGNEGDLILCDFSYYLVKDGFGPSIDLSPHVEWKSNKTLIKIVSSVDGQSWVREPLTLEDGSTQVSPFVVLK